MLETVSACLLRTSSLVFFFLKQERSISTDMTIAPVIAQAIPATSSNFGISCKITASRIVCITHYDYTIALAGPASPKVAE